jgi:hypothetical protein
LKSRAALALAAAAAFVALAAAKIVRDPNVAFLAARPPARWLRVPGAAFLGTHEYAPRFADFRTRFEAPSFGLDEELILRANGASEVVVDGRVALEPGDAAEPRGERRVRLRAGPGVHDLTVVVRNEGGPPLLWAELPRLGLYTGTKWEVSADGAKSWSPAQDAESPMATDAFDVLPSAASGFLATVFFAVPFLFLGGWLARSARADAVIVAAAAVAWCALAAAAFFVLAPGSGYDAPDHLDYVRRLAETGRLPGPGDGWQMFQAPLYYLVCVPLWRAATALGAEASSWLRLPSVLAGFVLGLSCRYFVKAVRPGAERGAAAGLFGWFWPAGLLIAQSPSNEPLAGALSALFLAACARSSASKSRLGSLEAAVLGALLGAAFLSKATAVLVVVPGAFLLLGRLRREARAEAARAVAVFSVAAFAAGGWFYARTWLAYGAPFIGGWDPSRGIRWWQDPGVRSAGDFLRFGTALSRPFYSGLNGFWDALYSSFWTDGWLSGATSTRALAPRPALWLAAGAWWGLVPTFLIGLGAARAFKRDDAASGAALLGMGTGLKALAWIFLTVPFYSPGKATYLLGLAPLFALLLADGLEVLSGVWRLAAWAGLAGWAAVAFRAALPL